MGTFSLIGVFQGLKVLASMSGKSITSLAGMAFVGWLAVSPAMAQGDPSPRTPERKITVMPKSVTHTKVAEDKHLYRVKGIYQGSVKRQLDPSQEYQALMPGCTAVELDFARGLCVFTTSRAVSLPELADALDAMAGMSGDLPYWIELEARDLPEGGAAHPPYEVSVTEAVPPAGLAWHHLPDDQEFRMPLGQGGPGGTLLIMPATAYCMCHSRYVIRILDHEGKVAWTDKETAFAGIKVALSDPEGHGRHQIWIERNDHGGKKMFLIR